MRLFEQISTLFMELSWRFGALVTKYPWLVYALDLAEELI